MTTPEELRKVKRLAVHEAVFKGVEGSDSSPNVQATCMKEFWGYVKKKFENVEEVVILAEESRGKVMEADGVTEWMEGMLGCVLSKDEVRTGSGKESLMDGLEMGLRLVEARGGWKTPRWEVLDFPSEIAGIDNWPSSCLEEQQNPGGKEKSQEVLDRIIVPHRRAVTKEGRGFWMGGELPYWHHLAKM
jgi:hypothetical protein